MKDGDSKPRPARAKGRPAPARLAVRGGVRGRSVRAGQAGDGAAAQVGGGAAAQAGGGAAARLSSVAFGSLGAGLVIAAPVSIALGLPRRAYNLAPLAGPGDVLGRLGELTPLIATGLAALVAAAVVIQLGARRLHPLTAAAELIVLGAAVVVCAMGSIGRVGYSADGSVLAAGIAYLAGGAALVSAGIVATLVRE
jgi:hypothetical protein